MSGNHTVRIPIVCALQQVCVCRINKIMQMQLKCVEYCSCCSLHGISVTNRFVSAHWLQNGILLALVFIDMDMSYTRVLHVKVAYRVPHK
jgi:hypothetical protein